jgi:hypothetical protein
MAAATHFGLRDMGRKVPVRGALRRGISSGMDAAPISSAASIMAPRLSGA